MRKNEKLKICFAASSGGHFEQIMMLIPMMVKYDSFILTEKTQYVVDVKDQKTYYVPQINRKERWSLIKLAAIVIKSFSVFVKEKPDAIICTGVLAMVPMCMVMKLFRRKVIYIESFAKVTSPTQSGKFLYKFADQFYVQWESMKTVYPNSIYIGGIY